MKWRQNTQVIALVHTKTPPSCCVSSKLDYKQSLELFSLSVDFNARKRESSQSSLQLKTGTVLSTERIHVHYGWKTNGPFSSSKTVIYHFHFNGFTPSPTLKQRLVATRKWPIGFHVFLSWIFDYPHTNSPNWSLYISLKNKLREFDKRSKYFFVGDHSINSHTFPPDCLLTLLRENWCRSPLGLKQLIEATCTPWVPILCFWFWCCPCSSSFQLWSQHLCRPTTRTENCSFAVPTTEEKRPWCDSTSGDGWWGWEI